MDLGEMKQVGVGWSSRDGLGWLESAPGAASSWVALRCGRALLAKARSMISMQIKDLSIENISHKVSTVTGSYDIVRLKIQSI